MAHGHFLWTDLSTYDVDTAQNDYAALFGWSFANDADYSFALSGDTPVAAVFPMPARLADMGMPSFWMSYVHVDNLDAMVSRARSFENVVIELEPHAFNSEARIALVRDPSGAGFTMYEGPDIGPKTNGPNRVSQRYHHLPDISLIEGFYADVFGWTFAKSREEPWSTYKVTHPDGSTVAVVEEVPENIRGKFRYWMPSFAVTDANFVHKALRDRSGSVLFDLGDDRSMVADRQGAHFMLQNTPQAEPAGATGTAAHGDRVLGAQEPTGRASFAWKAWAGLACMWIAVALDVQAFWGVLFLIWTWPAVRSGRTEFIEPISRTHQPLLYWALVGTWVVLSLWLILWPLLGS
ncbi:MAG: VOC family protein [Pseudomonadota bacterium]